MVLPDMPDPIRGNGGGRGFTLLEVLVGLGVLCIALSGLGVFYRGQMAGLLRSNQFSDGTQIALTCLERSKNRLADRASFSRAYLQAGQGSVETRQTETFNNRRFEVATRFDRAPPPLYGLRVVAEVVWNTNRRVELGVLVPGPGPTL
jgi:prepilin-type N-terminal cleavage/methylation domain-containing protein